jgi:hypothetical protein
MASKIRGAESSVLAESAVEAAICAEIEPTEKQRQMRVERCLEMKFIKEALFEDETQYQVNRLMRLILNLFLE